MHLACLIKKRKQGKTISSLCDLKATSINAIYQVENTRASAFVCLLKSASSSSKESSKARVMSSKTAAGSYALQCRWPFHGDAPEVASTQSDLNI